MIKRIFRSIINSIIKAKQCRIAKKKFSADKKAYIEQSKGQTSFLYEKKNEMPVLYEYKESAGSVDIHYFLQDIFVARYCHEHGFSHVYDIGSRIDGYIAHLVCGGGYNRYYDRYTTVSYCRGGVELHARRRAEFVRH